MSLRITFVIMMAGLASCVSPVKPFEKLPPGIWRGVLMLDRKPVTKYGDDRDVVKNFDKDSELPFNFEVVYDDSVHFHIVIHNAEERIKVDKIYYGTDRSTAKDTIIIDFPVYDTKIKAIYEDGIMEGEWIVNYREDYRIPFKAVHGVSKRFDFVPLPQDSLDLSGRYASTFEIGTSDQYPAVAVLKDAGENVSGTFLTETGDYRYLDGMVYKSKLYLSAFDGAHAFLIQGKIDADGKLGGIFRSGKHYTTNWEGARDEKASLKNGYDLTKAISAEPLKFSFVNTENKTVTLDDAQYKGKVKVIQIMGTWCPNCMDETHFLKEYFNKQGLDQVAWISLGFERYKDAGKNIAALRRFKTEEKLNHEVLYAGYYDKKEASKVMNQLDKIMAYPTMLIVDQNNKIIKVHTGFTGPATSDYTAFKQEFESLIASLIK
jgi:thiol-disulfide isomerase/thioredoxin